MSFFSNPKTVLWPKEGSLEVYRDTSSNNYFSFEINLWEQQSDENLRNLSLFLHQNKITEIYLLLSDNYVNTKTFVYDSLVTQLESKDVVTLAKDSVDFQISPEAVTFDLEPDNNRTLVRTRIFNQEKFNQLLANIQKLSLKVLSFETISSSIAKIYSHFDSNQYFFFYSLSNHDYLAILANNGQVYLTSIIKKTLPDLKKLLNYAQAYFGNKDPKQYYPDEGYRETEICQRFNRATNFPLPVLAFFASSQKPAAIIKAPMENTNFAPTSNSNRTLLPVIAVFILTAAAASVIVWFILNQNNKNTEVASPTGESLPTLVPTVELTQAPTPTIAQPSKDLKIQVLNATDINGQAATIKAELTKLGFKNVATGNAKESATSNSLQIKSTVSAAYFTQNIPEFASASTSELSASSSYDIVFVIGEDLKSNSSSATATVTPKATTTPKNTPTTTD